MKRLVEAYPPLKIAASSPVKIEKTSEKEIIVFQLPRSGAKIDIFKECIQQWVYFGEGILPRVKWRWCCKVWDD